MNKKKIRGWKRQLKKLEKWKQQNLTPHIDPKYKYDYVKIWLDPWYRLEKRNPPIWFRRLILKAMLDIYESWHKQLLEKGESFYLKIWFYDPHFIKSQLVTAVGDRMNHYETLFVANGSEKTFPHEKYAHEDYNLHEYDWQLRVDEDIYFELAEELLPEEIANLKKVAFRTERVSDGDTLYTVKKGNLWLGARKNV